MSHSLSLLTPPLHAAWRDGSQEMPVLHPAVLASPSHWEGCLGCTVLGVKCEGWGLQPWRVRAGWRLAFMSFPGVFWLMVMDPRHMWVCRQGLGWCWP